MWFQKMCIFANQDGHFQKTVQSSKYVVSNCGVEENQEDKAGFQQMLVNKYNWINKKNL